MGDSLHDRVAVVTGAGAGIGRAIAMKLAAEGASVVVSDIDESAAQKVAEEITAGGASAIALKVNANSPEDNELLVSTAVKEFGSCDLAVNNAGLGAPPTKLAEIDDATFNRAVDVTLRGTFYGMRSQLKQMEKQGQGAIVNISSIAGLQASRLLSPYIAAKHGVVGLTQTAALDYADQGIRINSVAPGPVRTAAFATLPEERVKEEENKVPLKRLGEPEDIAEAVSFLLSDQASFITGVVLPVDGGSVVA